ncbi:MAG TPA: histidine triad nucleotide-binding protein [Holophagaceae bacterium]|nr:histidine triad nucleotide-binding protein [Holophagaceae bacterium]
MGAKPLLAALALLSLLACQAPKAVAQAPAASTPAWVTLHPEYHADANCIFCKIVAGVAPSRKVYEDDRVVAFWDIAPRAPIHILVIPKQHIRSLDQLEQLPVETRAALLDACFKVAKEFGLTEHGFRVIANTGFDANQTVPHLHFHVVGGEKLLEDPITKPAAIKPDMAKSGSK